MKTLVATALFVVLLLPHQPTAAADAYPPQPASANRVPVTAVRVRADSIRELTRVQGDIETTQAPQIMSKVAAEVVEVLVEEGDRVSAGQVLARLDDEGFRLDREAAEADIARLRALLDQQQNTLQRDQSLTRQKLVSDAKLEDSQSAVKQTRAQLVHARSLLDKARYQLSHTLVLAPIGGTVQERRVSRGDYVNPTSPSSKPLFQIVDTEHLRARLYFPENLAERVVVGLPMELVAGHTKLAARVNRLRPMLEPGNRALQALADFDNRADWRPGESITAIAELSRQDRALVLPEAALVRRPKGLVVYRLESGKAREQPVTTGIRQGDRVELLSGVAEGDLLALDGAAYLSDGADVDIQGKTP